MLLCDADIQFEVNNGFMTIDPFDPKMIQPASYDCRLSNKFLYLPKDDVTGNIDPSRNQSYLYEEIESNVLYLRPGDFILGMTREYVEIPRKLAARIEGKSSLGRCGLVVHSTAGFIDPGYKGRVTLELANFAHLPIKLRAGMKIAQLAFFKLTNPCDNPYGSEGLNSKYQNSIKPTSSLSYLDNDDES